MLVIRALNVLLLVWMVSELYVLFGTRTRVSTGKVRDRGSLHVLWLVIFLAIWSGSWWGGTHPHTIYIGSRVTIAWGALGLFVVGLGIRWTAIFSLGKAFSSNVAIHEGQTLRRTGVYRFVRHPSYTGMFLIFLAIGLGSRNWIAMALVVVPSMAALFYRIHVEEQALGDAFGEDYATYRMETKRLIPGIY